MRIKARIYCRDHNEKIVYLRKKDRINRGFHAGSMTYLIDADHFSITSRRFGFIKLNYITYSYREGSPKPLPVPFFPEYANLGVDSAELNILYTPVFYRILAGLQKNVKLDWLLYIAGGGAAATLYNVYLTTKLPERIMEAIAKTFGGS